MEFNSLYNLDLRSNEFQAKVVAFYYKHWNDFNMPYHKHNSVEIMYVISGKCIVNTVNDSFSMRKGDFILLDANVPHNLVVDKDSPCRMLNIEFIFEQKTANFPSIKDLEQGNPVLASLLARARPYILLRDSDEVYHTLKNLVFELDKGSLNNEWMVQLQLAQLLIRMAGLAAELEDPSYQQIDLYVKNSMDYIHHHYDYPIQVKDIAASVNLHPGYFHRIFKSNTGQTVVEYLTSLRVEKAKMLLAHTDIPVAEISDSIGINSREYFSAIFKKYTGHTPGGYRKSIEKMSWTNLSEDFIHPTQ
ncbi:AraC family transcriptional regulator [Paenibacillus psychroresistens]|uniref:AraC family transcriptional regulator n=1 Tax=Paenibacillus psychroresistens TaxID=1778678 RepID=A0A6B8RI03_9BACL|nr:AraC family transcriptional regulator [Paenibacillus psychroresistens]QGQ95374.1 AraC family transcriptional regulator [Paenibacillus psychroresistens]